MTIIAIYEEHLYNIIDTKVEYKSFHQQKSNSRLLSIER